MSALKKFFAPVDMTTGVPWQKIALFTIPMVLGNIAQQLYNTVDSIVVGKFVGDNALAAVGSASPIFNLLLVLFIGISVGTGVMVSQYFGAKDRKQLSHAIGCSITLTAAASLVILVFGLIFVRPLLEMLNTPASIIDWCDSYLTILMIGGAGVAYYNILSGILRGMGDSFSALIYLLIATVINIVLDLFFVAGMGMGVPGVALATVIAQAVSALLCFRKLMKMTEVFDITPEYLKPTKHHSFTMIRLGLPSGLTQMIMSLAMIIVQSLTNSFGELFIAANVIIMRVDGFAMMPNLSFGNSMTTYTGQNVGAKRYDRVEKGSVQGAIMAVGVSTTITILILIFGKYLMGMFTTTEELINLGMSMMCILAPGYIAVALSQSLS
ncbi:MAG: MATE family efflux transporter, partial [Lachnospiraceae bacterium]|nr:MATE family efflux transporter [Lachnospiraceae bacterium]